MPKKYFYWFVLDWLFILINCKWSKIFLLFFYFFHWFRCVFDGDCHSLKAGEWLKRNGANVQKRDFYNLTIGNLGPDPDDAYVKKIAKWCLSMSKRHVDELIQVLVSCGVPHVIAAHDVEAECAILKRQGLADFNMTRDMDALPFGSERQLFYDGIIIDHLYIPIIRSGRCAWSVEDDYESGEYVDK